MVGAVVVPFRFFAYGGRMIRGILVALGATVVLCSGCQARVGSDVEVPEDAAQTCQGHCHSIGMELSAVAVMANNVGCICQFRGGAASGAVSDAEAKAAITAGMATIMLQAHAQQQQQQAQRASQ